MCTGNAQTRNLKKRIILRWRNFSTLFENVYPSGYANRILDKIEPFVEFVETDVETDVEAAQTRYIIAQINTNTNAFEVIKIYKQMDKKGFNVLMSIKEELSTSPA